jgi:hypothetical protein
MSQKEKQDMYADMEIALQFSRYIAYPLVDPATGNNLRAFYLREAPRVLGTINDSVAKGVLESVIEIYS